MYRACIRTALSSRPYRLPVPMIRESGCFFSVRVVVRRVCHLLSAAFSGQDLPDRTQRSWHPVSLNTAKQLLESILLRFCNHSGTVQAAIQIHREGRELLLFSSWIIKVRSGKESGQGSCGATGTCVSCPSDTERSWRHRQSTISSRQMTIRNTNGRTGI